MASAWRRSRSPLSSLCFRVSESDPCTNECVSDGS
jgi:hypothetical protein